MKSGLSLEELEQLYRSYHRRDYLEQDPLVWAHRYQDAADQELSAFWASCLALGRLEPMLEAIGRVLKPLGPHPAAFLQEATEARLESLWSGFRYRFFHGGHIASLMQACAVTLRDQGSLGGLWQNCLPTDPPEDKHEDSPEDGPKDIVPRLGAFVRALWDKAPNATAILLSDPLGGGAVKRLFLFLRWMSRKDQLDLGLWPFLSPRDLLVPLDTHMQRWARAQGIVQRSTVNLAMAREITGAFRKISPQDPLRYDFALVHRGMELHRTR